MKILLAPIEIAGYMGRLNLGFKELGVKSKFYNLSEQYTQYEGSDAVWYLSFYKYCKKIIGVYPIIIQKFIFFPISFMTRLLLFLNSLIWPSVVVFGFASSYLGGWELPIYRVLKKKVIVIYFGSDSRPLYLNARTILDKNWSGIEKCYQQTKKQKNRLRWFDLNASHIIDHPPCGQFHIKPFIPFLYIGIPGPKVVDSFDNHESDKIVILHAPSFPEGKGTDIIRGVIARKKEKNPQIEYVELIGKTNQEVLFWLSRSTFVIDELYSDSILASLGTEAATYGKATLVAGYVGDTELGISPNMIPPAFKVYPDEFESTLDYMLSNISEVKIKGQYAKNFVSTVWNRTEVAKRMLQVIKGVIDPEVLFDPQKCTYFLGWGFSKRKLQEFLQRYYLLFGKHGFLVNDKELLRSSMIKFVAGDPSV